MDPSEPRPSPRRELQGPRPTPLKVNKDSYKIKKPPVAPARPPYHLQDAAAQPLHQHQQGHPQPPRGPVIIYTVSPKIIHTKPDDFMTLVQLLTGPDASDDPVAAAADFSLPSPSGGALSPAAKIAAFEKSSPPSQQPTVLRVPDGDQTRLPVVDQLEMFDGAGIAMDRPDSFPGILSPMPASLPQISPSFFSSSLPFDPSVLSFLQDLSPAVGGNNSYNNNNNNMVIGGGGGGGGFVDLGNFLVSPGSNNLWLTPTVPSPGTFSEFLSHFPDL